MDTTSDEPGNNSWQALRASMSRWLLVMFISAWVFVGTLYAGFLLDRWAYPNLQDRSGDAFLSFCASVVLAIVSWRLLARWTRGSTGR